MSAELSETYTALQDTVNGLESYPFRQQALERIGRALEELAEQQRTEKQFAARRAALAEYLETVSAHISPLR